MTATACSCKPHPKHPAAQVCTCPAGFTDLSTKLTELRFQVEDARERGDEVEAERLDAERKELRVRYDAMLGETSQPRMDAAAAVVPSERDIAQARLECRASAPNARSDASIGFGGEMFRASHEANVQRRARELAKERGR
ncbi:MAG TPA: hypothetical protein VGG74_24605 [Kofleriaceae bacterium]|jgi:hypothetical protein